MKDMQSERDGRRINIRKVGVKHIRYPIIVLDKEQRAQKTVAEVNMYVNLPHQFKGTHMSRFVEILNCFHTKLDLHAFQLILETMKAKLHSETAQVEMFFPYFFHSPKHQRLGVIPASRPLLRYDCRIHGALDAELDVMVEVTVPIYIQTAPSDDAAEIEQYAPCRWGEAVVAVRMRRFLWIEDLIALVESALRQPTTVTEVEALCQAISKALHQAGAFRWYKIVVKKSAKGYAPCASIEWPTPQPFGPLSIGQAL